MKNYKIKTSFVSPESPRANTGMIFYLIFVENFCNTMLYMIFQNISEPVLIHRILIGIKAIILIPFFVLNLLSNFVVSYLYVYFLAK